MAHIPDGVLSAPVLITGAGVSLVLVAAGLRRLDEENLPRAAVLAAVFFVASLISVPVGPTTVHLLLNGLMGLVLGVAAAPALLVALLLQAVFFGFGGLIVLGVNTMNMAVPAVVCALVLRPLLARLTVGPPTPARGRLAVVLGVAAGALGVTLTAVMLAGSLALSGEAFVPAARLIAVSYLPLAVVEAVITGIIVGFLFRVEPELLAVGRGAHG